MPTQGYCVKCKTKREMNNVSMTKTKRGVPMAKGTCPHCHTKMCRIGGK